MSKAVNDSNNVKCEFRIPNVAIQSAANAGIGAVTAHIFNIVHPAAGAIFGAVQGLIYRLVKPGVKDILGNSDSCIAQIATFALSLLTGIGMGILAATAAGFELTFFAGLILSLAMIPLSLLVDALFNHFCANTSETKTA